MTIFGGGEHNTGWVTTYPLRIALGDPLAGKDGHPASKGRTTIGNDVWIGREAVIMPGVTIGDGAIIGTRAQVTKDVPAYAVVAGNPGRIVKMRFPPEIVGELLAIRWWDWEAEKIARHVAAIQGADIDALHAAV